uniref:Uncharacterized protein n=1 Tax=Anguilla anguilla TaxID=7936 RepID=A0A0E9WYU0_ANGAN
MCLLIWKDLPSPPHTGLSLPSVVCPTKGVMGSSLIPSLMPCNHTLHYIPLAEHHNMQQYVNELFLVSTVNIC